MNKRLTTDMADSNGLQRAIRPTGFFNIKKMAADVCSAQCIMDNTGSLTIHMVVPGLSMPIQAAFTSKAVTRIFQRDIAS